MKLYVTKKLSKGNNPYTCLCIDLGYREAIVSFNTNLCVELSGKSFSDVANLKVGEQIFVGNILTKV